MGLMQEISLENELPKIGSELLGRSTSYTVKAYHSTKTVDPNAGWKHERITLKPSNPNYRDIIISPNEADDFRIVAFFIEVLTIDGEDVA